MTDEDGAIDYWCNPFTTDWLTRLYREPSEFEWVASSWSLGTRLNGFTVGAFREQMAVAGFSRVGIPAMQVYNFVDRHLVWNSRAREIADLVQEAPDLLFGLFGINPLTKMQGVRDLRRSVHEFGFRGAVVHPHGFGLSPDSREWFPFYALCAELEIPVFILVGHAAEEMPSAPGRPLNLENIALYFPELRIVGCSGWPWVTEMISMAWKFPNVYYGTSQFSPKRWPKDLLDFIAGNGRGKVLLGSGFPVLDHIRMMSDVKALNFPEPALDALLHTTAAQVFGWGDDE